MSAGRKVEPSAGSTDAAPPRLSRLVPSWVPQDARLWFLVGVAISSIVILKDSSTLLGLVQNAGQRSYNASAFSGFKLKFWDVKDLQEAIAVWALVQAEGGLPVRRLIGWHLAVDALIFVPAYCVLLHRLLRKVGASRPVYFGMVLLLFVVDELETVISWVVLVGFRLKLDAVWVLIPIQLLSTAKWLILLAALASAFFLWRTPRVAGEVGYADLSRAMSSARAGGIQVPAHALAGLIVLTLAFAGLIGLPAGGPLDQIPDVIRYQLGGHLEVWLLSSVALFLFASALLIAGLMSTDPKHEEVPPDQLHTLPVFLVSLAVAAVLELLALLFQGRLGVIPLAFPGLVIVIWVVSKVVEFARRGTFTEQKEMFVGSETPAMKELARENWIGALVGIIVMAAGLGMVRASYPPALLLPEQKGWWLGLAAGALGATAGGWLAQRLVVFVCHELRDGVPSSLRRALSIVFWVLLPLLIVAVILALANQPSQAWRMGSTGVVATGFAGYALLIGVLKWISRRWAGWEAVAQLGFGRRTSWISLFLITIIVASVLDTKGGYHDARVAERFGPSAHLYSNLEDAFTQWKTAQAGCPGVDGGAVPLVLVAAPGGGIRAAYWTASAMQDLFGSDGTSCASRRVFAMSGVSGGSVGTAAWVATTASNHERGGIDQTPRATVAFISEDRSLASTLVGMLLRDSFQPLIGLGKSGLDRASLMENGWEESAGVFTHEGGGSISFQELGEGLDWVPAITLNGSSVRDGCRVLVSNVGMLPGALPPDCQAAPGLKTPAGPVSGAIDPFLGLNGTQDADPGNCPAGGGSVTRFGMRATTAALLSARFPYVTPSGAIRRCFSGSELVSYDVDGGYYENSGLLTVVQIWEELALLVDVHNAGLEGGPAPGGSSSLTAPIEPWIILLDNHYRTSAISAPPRRPLELLVPLITKSETLSQTALEQVAARAMSDADDGGTGTAPTYFRLAPGAEPGVTAPLGWVLSEQTREDLNCELRDQLKTVPKAFTDAIGSPGVTEIRC